MNVSVSDAVISEMNTRLDNATHIIVTAGAGWSADSGLPTYNGSAFYASAGTDDAGVTLSYREVCRPVWGRTDGSDRDNIFIPFWQRCAQEYLGATPHAGHSILSRLLSNTDHHIYTSNVDGQFLRSGFPREKVTEVHGSIFGWQCCVPEVCAAGKTAGAVFQLPKGEFFVERCVHCAGPARPHIVMFGDDDCIQTPSMGGTYQAWEEEMEAKETGVSLVVLEFGCGKNVPALREEGEWVVRDVCAKFGETAASLYRVNKSPEDAEADDTSVAKQVIPVHAGALEVLQRLEEIRYNTEATP